MRNPARDGSVRILVTGFEPFGGKSQNASQAMLRSLPGKMGFRVPVELRAEILPVLYGEADKRLMELLDDYRPHLVIATGESSDPYFRIETQAVNLDKSPKADNAGVVRNGYSISRTGETFHHSSLPVLEIRRRMELAGFDTRTSRDAGGFLCNHVFYLLMERAASGAGPALAGFLHVPSVPEGKSPEQWGEWGARALEVALETSLQALLPQEEGPNRQVSATEQSQSRR